MGLDQPTPEEIDRVDAWRARERDQQNEAWLERTHRLEATRLSELRLKLIGFIIKNVEAGQSDGDFKSITITLVNASGTEIEIEPNATSLFVKIDGKHF